MRVTRSVLLALAASTSTRATITGCDGDERRVVVARTSVDRTWANGAGCRCNQVIAGPAEQRIGLSYTLEIPGMAASADAFSAESRRPSEAIESVRMGACRCIHPYADDTCYDVLGMI
jgi:hypothetical protein